MCLIRLIRLVPTLDEMDHLDYLDRNLPLQRAYTVQLRVAADSELLNKPVPIAEIAVSEHATTPSRAREKPRVLGTPGVSD